MPSRGSDAGDDADQGCAADQLELLAYPGAIDARVKPLAIDNARDQRDAIGRDAKLLH